MLPKAVNLLLIILLSSSLTNGVRRKSKIDVPVAAAADAPSNDNAAATAAAASSAAATAASSDAQPTSNLFEDQPSAQALAATEKPTAAPIVMQPNAISNNLPSSAGADSSSSLGDNAMASGENDAIECDPDMIGFEIITGYVRLQSVETSVYIFKLQRNGMFLSHFEKCNPRQMCAQCACFAQVPISAFVKLICVDYILF